MNKEKKVEAVFSADGQSRILTDPNISGDCPLTAVVTWGSEGIRLYLRNSRGGSIKTPTDNLFPTPKSPLTQFQIGSTDRAQAFEGVVAETVVYSTALKEDQASVVLKDLFDYYLQVPKPKPLSERLARKQGLFADRNKWKLSANQNGKPEDLARMVDGDTSSRWSSYASQKTDMAVKIDLGSERNVEGIAIDAAGSPNDYARQLAVDSSLDGNAWTEQTQINASSPLIELKLPQPVKSRWLRLRLVGSVSNHWSINELAIFGS